MLGKIQLLFYIFRFKYIERDLLSPKYVFLYDVVIWVEIISVAKECFVFLC